MSRESEYWGMVTVIFSIKNKTHCIPYNVMGFSCSRLIPAWEHSRKPYFLSILNPSSKISCISVAKRVKRLTSMQYHNSTYNIRGNVSHRHWDTAESTIIGNMQTDCLLLACGKCQVIWLSRTWNDPSNFFSFFSRRSKLSCISLHIPPFNSVHE